MKTEKELNYDILKTTRTIAAKYPELSKYIEEMPVKMLYTRDTKIDRITLQDYYESLESFLKHYGVSHRADSIKINEMRLDSFQFQQN